MRLACELDGVAEHSRHCLCSETWEVEFKPGLIHIIFIFIFIRDEASA